MSSETIAAADLSVLEGRLSAERAGYLDNLDAPFKSIQSGKITIAASASAGTATITSVDITKSILLYLGTQGDSTAGVLVDHNLTALTFTNATTITANRTVQDASIMYVGYMVIEWT